MRSQYSDCELAAEAVTRKSGARQAGKMRRVLAPQPRRSSGDGHGADRVVPDHEFLCPVATTTKPLASIASTNTDRMGRDIKFEQQRRHRSRSRRRTAAERPPCSPAVHKPWSSRPQPAKNERNAAGAVAEFHAAQFRLPEGRSGDRSAPTLAHAAAPGTRRNRRCVGAALRQPGSNGKAVIGGAGSSAQTARP